MTEPTERGLRLDRSLDRRLDRRSDRRASRHEPWPGRGLRSMDLRNLPLIVVLAVAGTGIGYAAAQPQHWLRGVLMLAGAMVLGGVLRLVLPARQAGLLAVRSRFVDVLCYAGSGIAIILLAAALLTRQAA
jgi:hypothetical protein